MIIVARQEFPIRPQVFQINKIEPVELGRAVNRFIRDVLVEHPNYLYSTNEQRRANALLRRLELELFRILEATNPRNLKKIDGSFVLYFARSLPKSACGEGVLKSFPEVQRQALAWLKKVSSLKNDIADLKAPERKTATDFSIWLERLSEALAGDNV